mmetsp:Transcript_24920/g.50707  ORF Transcript_24920/g.50707 Transcript_24920/m.50707 type:complete len:89 (+) Transcript_24920:255-521(+)
MSGDDGYRNSFPASPIFPRRGWDRGGGVVLGFPGLEAEVETVHRASGSVGDNLALRDEAASSFRYRSNRRLSKQRSRRNSFLFGKVRS